eukprot:gb/GFBE01054483.1/.p1 GENE.gb/GFBE01054483.1/~~gb/GFBE01054483.1/.p1  ORF type:complete len:482 (+),score=80.86 gb/GFBE01054483.1/:1-1446(+)
MGAQASAEASLPRHQTAPQVSRTSGSEAAAPKMCRQICCDASREEVVELFEGGDGRVIEDQVVPVSVRAARSQQRVPGWPEHFEHELDELRVLGVLGFELRGMGPRPAHRFQSGAVYQGQWSGNQREGFGKQTWPDGARYEGFWSGSSANGPGRFRFPDGSVYLGQWRGNRFHGLGAYYTADGSAYRGQWVHGLCEGLGVEIRSGQEDGQPAATYWGNFFRGAKDGPGMCKWDEGSKYVGEWRSGQISGYGALTSEEGQRSYRGQWMRAMKHGRGVYKWPDGREHKGQYKLDAAFGFGSLIWPDGKRYDGFWRNACITGVGAFTDADGKRRPLPPGLLDSSTFMRTKEDVDEQKRRRRQDQKKVENLQLAMPQATGLDIEVECAENQDEPSTSPGSSTGSANINVPPTPLSQVSSVSVPLESERGARGSILVPSQDPSADAESPESPVTQKREGSRMMKPLKAAASVTQNIFRRAAARAGA